MHYVLRERFTPSGFYKRLNDGRTTSSCVWQLQSAQRKKRVCRMRRFGLKLTTEEKQASFRSSLTRAIINALKFRACAPLFYSGKIEIDQDLFSLFASHGLTRSWTSAHHVLTNNDIPVRRYNSKGLSIGIKMDTFVAKVSRKTPICFFNQALDELQTDEAFFFSYKFQPDF